MLPVHLLPSASPVAEKTRGVVDVEGGGDRRMEDPRYYYTEEDPYTE
jgi:hypothetical protein